MTRSGDLYELQKIDSSLDKYKSRLREIDGILGDNSELRSAEVNFMATERAVNKSLSELKTAEKKVKDQRLKIKSTDAKLYSGKINNPKELKDLQDESEALKRFLTILEDRQLEKMLGLDEFVEKHEISKINLEATRHSIKSLHDELQKERENIEHEINYLNTRRQSSITSIPVEDLVLYDKLRSKGHGVAVTEVRNRSCSACGATLTAALYQAARSPNQITLCATCGRILYD